MPNPGGSQPNDRLVPTGSFDIADPDDQQRLLDLADGLLAAGGDLTGPKADGVPLDEAIARRLALSQEAVRGTDWTGSVAVVFAMWGEQRRLRPRTEDNPTGEDSLHTKLDQLGWLFAGSSIDWRLIAVDDGDPDDSATVAAERAGHHPLGDRVTVLRLADAIPTSTGPLAGLGSVDDSRKGGAIVLGAQQAYEAGVDAVVMTDADNSVHLGQLGLLLGPHLGGADVVIGDRKRADAVLLKAEDRWGPGIVALRHMQRMVGRALFGRGVNDTQAAFKLYGRQTLEHILAAPSTYGFAFDSDWLYAALAAGSEIESVGFAFIDSFAESASITQGPMTTWESLLTGLVTAARARGVDHHEEMARVVDRWGRAEVLERVITQVPPELQDVPASALGDPAVMAPSSLDRWLRSVAGDEAGTE